MPIRGRFDATGKPLVRAELRVHGAQRRGQLDFIIDTGATDIILSHTDAVNLRVNFHLLQAPVKGQGLNGSLDLYEGRADLIFTDRGSVYDYLNTRIFIPGSPRGNYEAPSLLGQEILRNWRMIICFDKAEMTIEPNQPPSFGFP